MFVLIVQQKFALKTTLALSSIGYPMWVLITYCPNNSTGVMYSSHKCPFLRLKNVY